MALWPRLKALIKSKIRKWRNDDDPREVLRKNLAKMERYLQKIKKSSLELGREKGTLQRRLQRLNKAIEEFDEEAKEALKLGEENQAEMALKEKYQVIERKRKLESNLKLLEKRILSLERSKDTLKNRIEIFRTKEAELDALRSASEAELRISEITAGMNEDTFDDINRAVQQSERKLEQIQAKVKATRELMSEKDLTDLEGAVGQPELDEGEDEMDPEKELEQMKESLKQEE